MQTLAKKKKEIKWLQYFLIYWLLLDAGAAAVAVITTNVYFLSLLGFGLGICILYRNRMDFRLSFKYRFQAFALVFLVLLICNFITSMGGTSYTIVLSMVGRIAIVLAAVTLDRDQFATRFVQVVSILAAISLVIYIGYAMFGTSFWSPIASRLYHYSRGNLSLGDQYGLFLLAFNYFDPTRNTYIFGEPGEYQLVLSAALFLILNLKIGFTPKARRWIIILLVVTMITTQSTSGYLNLFVIMACAVLNQERGWNAKYFNSNRKIILLLVIIALCYFLMFSNGADLWNKVIHEKIFDESGSVNLEQNTGAARWSGFTKLWDYAKKNPFEAIFGIGVTARTDTGVTSCNGFTNNILDFGLVTMLWLVYSFMTALYRYTNRNFLTMLAGMFIIMNTWFGQPVPLYTLMIVIAFVPMFVANPRGGTYEPKGTTLQNIQKTS